MEAPVFCDEKVGPIDTNLGIRLSRAEMQRLACDALITIVTFDGNRVPIDLARTEYRDFVRRPPPSVDLPVPNRRS